MKDKRASYEADAVKDFRELINRTEKLYPDYIAYKYKIRHGKDDAEYVCKTYSQFQKDIEGLATRTNSNGLTREKSCSYWE